VDQVGLLIMTFLWKFINYDYDMITNI